MFYDRFVHLCELKGVKATRAAVDVGIAKSAVTNWKTNYQKGIEVLPNAANASALADYFGVTVDYLLGNDESLNRTSLDADLDPDIRRIERARKQMNDKEKERMMKILKASFDEYFSDTFEVDDDDE